MVRNIEADRPVAPEGHAADEPALSAHSSDRSVAAEGHAVDVCCSCDGHAVSDLSPLKDMKLTNLWVRLSRQVSDLSPLKDMKLTNFWN